MCSSFSVMKMTCALYCTCACSLHIHVHVQLYMYLSWPEICCYSFIQVHVPVLCHVYIQCIEIKKQYIFQSFMPMPLLSISIFSPKSHSLLLVNVCDLYFTLLKYMYCTSKGVIHVHVRVHEFIIKRCIYNVHVPAKFTFIIIASENSQCMTISFVQQCYGERSSVG